RPKWLDDDSFINWADDMMLDEGWSPDSVVGHAKEYKLFPKEIIPCTSTLYKWIDSGIMRTKNIDLLEKVSRKPRNDSPKPENIAEYSALPSKKDRTMSSRVNTLGIG